MKKGWQIKKLGEVCKICTGKSNTQDAVANGRYAFFDRSKIIKRSSKYLFDCDAIIIAGEGQSFLPKFYSGKFDLHQRAYAIFGFDGNVSIEYAYKYLIHFHKYFEEVAVGATAKSLRLRHFQDLPIPLPPLPEQKRIVAVLDEAFAAIAAAKENAEKNLKNARELFESSLQDIFTNPGDGWEEKKLGEICEISSKLIDPQREAYLDLYHVGGANIESQTGRLIDLETSRNENLLSGKFIFDNSMVLYSKIRPYLVKVVRPNFAGLCSADIYPLKPVASLLDRSFLYFLLLTKNFTVFAISGSGRAGMPKVNREHLFSYSTFLPPLPEQKRIVAKLDSLSAETKKLEAIYKQKLSDLAELKKSVLQKAFNGELDGVSL